MTDTAALAAVELTARRQYGLFTTADATAAGVTRNMLRHHSMKGGRWRRVAPRVYRVLAQPRDWHQPLMAALLWGGPEAVLSHLSAAWLLRLDGIGPTPAELYLPNRRPHPRWTVRRGRVPFMTTDRLRHTTPLRTLDDLAATLDPSALELVLESLLRHDSVSEGDLKDVAAHRPCLRRVLSNRPPGTPPTGSELETRFVQLVRPLGLADLVRQHAVRDHDGRPGVYIDLCWPEQQLFIELDGRAWHSHPGALYKDRHRQNRIGVQLGWTPLRYTWDDVVERPRQTATEVKAAYHRGSPSTRSPMMLR